MLHKILHMIKMNPLRMGVYSLKVIASGLGSLSKNNPLDLLLAFVTDRYDIPTAVELSTCIGVGGWG